jgi:serpin B
MGLLRLALLALLGVTLVACGSTPVEQRDPRKITALSPELAAVVQGNNAFAWSLYDQLRREDGNLFVSPFSISAAFGMTYAGARGQTAAEMKQVLHIELDDAAYHSSFGALLQDLTGPHRGRGYQLDVANRLFGQQGFNFNSDFLQLTADDYDAPLQQMDFTGDPDGSRQTINGWVEAETQNRIQDLLQPGTVTSDTRLVLANAIYFKARWAARFDPKDTHDADFTRADGSTVKAPMMNNFGTYALLTDADVSVIELPYQDNELSMVVILPAATDGLPALEASITQQKVKTWIGSLSKADEVSVGLPRFTMTHRVPLKQTLVDMGMKLAFSDQADLSGIAPGLMLTDAVHRAFVKVDEEGTEAAAATAAVVGLTSAGPMFYADHPFLFLIRDRLTGSILFMGRVDDPTATG